MGKLLGSPGTEASAQLRLMVPIAVISGFLNNTPVVAVMIPIVQKWGRGLSGLGVSSPRQLLIPLSFASILGGTCTLIGTSTNLVVVGLLKERYGGENGDGDGGEKLGDVGLFDLGLYGVPIALVGMSYILIASPFLLPDGSKFVGASSSSNNGTPDPTVLDDSILLGARLTKWSGAAGRSVKRSGLRDTGGLYLVSVHRAATGNVHRAVGQDFVLNVGDVLYFTGLVEEFGNFCQENGLELVTNEVEEDNDVVVDVVGTAGGGSGGQEEDNDRNVEHYPQDIDDTILGNKSRNSGHDTAYTSLSTKTFTTTSKVRLSVIAEIDSDMGTTKESLLQCDEAERWRSINRVQDAIRGIATTDAEGTTNIRSLPLQQHRRNANAKIVVVSDTSGDDARPLVVVAVDARDRPGLLLDVSKTLIRLGLNFHHTEAIVGENQRSLSLWRCEVLKDGGVSDIEEIWSVLSAMLEDGSGLEAIKHRGLRVVRAVVTKQSNLVGLNAAEANFREKYKAAIVAVQRGGQSSTEKLSLIQFQANDMLILQANDNSPLLLRPPEEFYKTQKRTRSTSPAALSRFIKKKFGSFGSQSDLLSIKSDKSDGSARTNSSEVEKKNLLLGADLEDQKLSAAYDAGDAVENQPGLDISDGAWDESTAENFLFDTEGSNNELTEPPAIISGPKVDEEMKRIENEEIWKDLAVVFSSAKQEDTESQSEPLSREFLTAMEITRRSKLAKKSVIELGLNKLPGVFLVSIERQVEQTTEEENTRIKVTICPKSKDSRLVESFDDTKQSVFPVSNEDPLIEGDVLWFSGSAAAVGDLRKIPGLKSFVNEEVKKINEKVHDRRLVQAVIARKGALVGKNVKDARFRTRFGAAVIAVHREGKRIQEHPGTIILQAGDVLLLEAGPTFIKENADSDKSFSLLSEVQGSAPPRLRLLIPALVLAVAMLTVYTAGVASLLVCGLVASILMVCFGILSQQEARDAINWDVYVTIACAFGIGTALTNSGVAGGIADGLVKLGQAINIGDAGLFGAVYFATFLISNVVTNNAAAALLFPVAMDAAEMTGADRKLMSYILMLGASASFMSPFGYTTNLLIYGPGGYKYTDFLRIGTPMQVVLWIFSVCIVSIDEDSWYISWIASSVLFIIVSVVMTSGGFSHKSCLPNKA